MCFFSGLFGLDLMCMNETRVPNNVHILLSLMCGLLASWLNVLDRQMHACMHLCMNALIYLISDVRVHLQIQRCIFHHQNDVHMSVCNVTRGLCKNFIVQCTFEILKVSCTTWSGPARAEK